MKRAILLQTVATNSKNSRLKRFMGKALKEYNTLLSERENCNTFMQFHHKTLLASKERTSFNVQVRCSLIRQAWRKKAMRVRRLTVKFNVPRNCKVFGTKTKLFVRLGMYPFTGRIAVPVRQNRSFQRYVSLVKSGWVCKTFGLTQDLQLVAFLSKEESSFPNRGNVLGVDVNARYFAVSVVSPGGRVLCQTYLGKHIWNRRKRFMERKAMLQSVNNTKALRKTKCKERNFVKTNLGQMVAEIIKIANKFNADIAIEDLERFKRLNRKANRKIMRIPFYQFRQILEQRCFDYHIHLDIVDAYHTSKWCSHCGAVGNGHSSNYSLFKCNCGQAVNADRKASLAVAVKSLLERANHVSNPDNFFVQISNRRVSVNGLLRSDDIGVKCAVHDIQPLEGMPTGFSRG